MNYCLLWNSPPGFICSSCWEGSMERCEMLASASNVIVIALKYLDIEKMVLVAKNMCY